MDLNWFRIDKRPATVSEVSNIHIEIDGKAVNEVEIIDQLKGKYDFNDAEDNFDESCYKWYVEGVEQDSTSGKLVVTQEMVKKSIEFEVTAKADKELKLGNTEKPNVSKVLEPNLYITAEVNNQEVDDFQTMQKWQQFSQSIGS